MTERSHNKKSIILIFLGLLLIGCADNIDRNLIIKVSAAVSLTDVLYEISSSYTDLTGIEVELNLSSSSIGARQIKEGKDSSLFLSANEKWVDYLSDDYIPGSKDILLTNTLVIVLPVESELSVNDLDDLKSDDLLRIATGDPAHVPAGIYAKESLMMNQLWDSVKDKIVGAIDVRAALTFVESGAVDCAIVYKSDALASDRVRIAYEIPEDKAPEIIYVICQLDDSEKSSRFYNYLFSSDSVKIFEKYGFSAEREGERIAGIY